MAAASRLASQCPHHRLDLADARGRRVFEHCLRKVDEQLNLALPTGEHQRRVSAGHLERLGQLHHVCRTINLHAEQVMLQFRLGVEVDSSQFGRLNRLHLSARLNDAVFVEVDHHMAKKAGRLSADVVGQAHVLNGRLGAPTRVVVQQVIPVSVEPLQVVADQLRQVLRDTDGCR